MPLLKISGREISQHYELVQAEISIGFDQVPAAEILLVYRSKAYGPHSPEGMSLMPGIHIEVMAAIPQDIQVALFSGNIASVRWEISGSGNSYLRLSCSHLTAQMVLSGPREIASAFSDSHLMERIITSHNLQPSIENTETISAHAPLERSNDWELLCSIARRNGCVIDCADSASVKVGPPRLKGEIAQKITCGAPGQSYHIGIHSQGFPQGPLRTISQLLSDHARPVDGKIFLQGHTSLRPGSLLELSGFGACYDGRAIVTGLVNHLEDGQWSSYLNFLGVSTLADRP